MEDYIAKNIFEDISSYHKWTTVEEVKKGWSKDKKFYIEDLDGIKYLLRLSSIESYESKKKEFEMMENVQSLGISMSQPVDFGTCGKGKYTYSILSWIEGIATDEIVQRLSKDQQYNLGVEAGKILKKFHSIPAPEGQQDWEERMVKKINIHLQRYKDCGIKVTGDHYAIKYIEDNLHLLKNRPQAYQHGDFHIGNLIVTDGHNLGVIDFNRWDYGDPYEEFYKMMLFSRELSIPFAIGQINGYFNDKVPEDFFNLLALYIADTILFSVVWALPFSGDEVKGMIKRAEMILTDYDNFNTTIPKWFIKN